MSINFTNGLVFSPVFEFYFCFYRSDLLSAEFSDKKD